MCGFIGILNEKQTKFKKDINIKTLNKLISHRGPDDCGYYKDNFINLGFRRLSIIDIKSGQQPLSFDNKRYWIVFNGEIYNHIELREELKKEGMIFHTNSDTEVLLALFSKKKEKMLEKIRGMFAFVIYDKKNQEVFAARDHFGIKPFYYLEDGERTFFASEKKSILLATKENSIDVESLQNYFTYQYVPEPKTLTKDIQKLEPGHFFFKKPKEKIETKKYFEANFNPKNNSLDNEKKIILETLKESVKIHMRSDVPVGCFLSGGIDSTSIVALAKEINPKIKTFTVGFEREGFSEIELAKETAKHLEVENIHHIITPKEFIKEIPRIVWLLDDPIADPAAIPLYFVAREAKKHVTVVLSGEGADELFGGYNIYNEPNSLKIFKYLPTFTKSKLLSLSQSLPKGVKGKSFIERGCTPIEKRFYGNAKIFNEKEKNELMQAYNPIFTYDKITKPMYDKMKNIDDITKMQTIDILTWLRGDILVKADRMTMAHSLELRVPFLDKEVFKVASEIQSKHKLTKGTTKFVLREAMANIIPNEALKRRKLGFPVPINHWLKNELYEWALKIIEESQTDYLVNKNFVLEMLKKHKNNQGDFSRKIWTVLIFMIWHQIYIENKYENLK